MGIVVVTIPGESKRAFINTLHERTGGKVDLVILQKQKSLSLYERFVRLYNRVGFFGLFREAWFGFLLRIHNETRKALEYFREHTPIDHRVPYYLPNTKEVSSINSDEVHKILQKLSPDLMIVWGGAVLKPHIIQTAKKAINLHLGYCPHYRGAIANQYAVLRKDYSRIGATIHYVDNGVDVGDIISVIAADPALPPRELFRDLNDRAHNEYLEVAHKLFNGEDMPVQAQHPAHGETFLLKTWTPSLRYKLGQQMRTWQQEVATRPSPYAFDNDPQRFNQVSFVEAEVGEEERA